MTLLLAFFLVQNIGNAQLNSFENIENYGEEGFFKNSLKGFFKGFADFGEPFQLGGGIGLGLRSYNASGGPLRQDPFFYSVNAHLNVRIYQIDLPVSVILTAKNTTSSYPNFSDLKESLSQKLRDKKNGFARIGMSPYYKWAKLHLGHRAMNFSKYTMSNLNFLGAGMELTPGKMRIGAMYGRLAKAEPIDLSLTTPNLPIYRRKGWAAKLGYGDDKASADISLFGAKDDHNSIFIPASYPSQVSPEANFAVGVQLQKLFFDVLRVKLDYGNSSMSPNALDASSDSRNLPNFLFKKKQTSYNSNAIEGSVGYEGKALNAGVMVNRVDSDYKTLGTYFFNRDIFDVQVFTNFGLLDGKLNTALKGGIQSNNLDEKQPTTTRRIIYDAQLNWSEEKLNAGFNYSNNSSRIAYILNQQLDSLNAVIVTQDMGINATYTLPSRGEMMHSVTATGNIQEVSDDVEKPNREVTSKVLLGSLGYLLKLPSDWAFNLKGNYTQNELAGISTDRLGYGLGVSKSLLKSKLTLGVDVNMFNNKNELNQKSKNFLGQIMIAYEIFKGMGLNLQWGILNTSSDITPKFTESTGNFGLQYQFNYSPKKKVKNKDTQNPNKN